MGNVKEKENWLLLDKQLCFKLYSVSKAVTSAYAPLLRPLDLTYPQYLAMLVLWEQGEVNVKDLGERLNLDSGTLSPLLKKLEVKDLLTRTRLADDERVVMIKLTKKGIELKKKAQNVPVELACRMDLNIKEMIDLQKKLDSLLSNLHATEDLEEDN